MKAIISLLGKQYLISENDEILTNKIEGKKGEKINISDVLLISDNDKIILGKPKIKDAEVKAEILETKKGEKIRVLKFKAKKRYKRVIGFRPIVSKLKISKILFKD